MALAIEATVCFLSVCLFVRLFTCIVPPQFVEIPKSIVEVIANSEASLTCRVFGFPQPTVVWSRGIVPLPQGRSTVFNGTLKISNFSRRDAGPYLCKTTNKLGTIKALTTLYYVQPGECRLNKKKKRFCHGISSSFKSSRVWFLMLGRYQQAQSYQSINKIQDGRTKDATI